MEFLKHTAMLTGIFAGLLAHPVWLCLAVFLFTMHKNIEAVAKLIEVIANMRPKDSHKPASKAKSRSPPS
jgi:hypothetical protein